MDVMSIVVVLILNLEATSFACSISVAVRVSFSGNRSPKTLSPPIALADNAAPVELSMPPDIPSTIPFALVFAT